MTTTYTEEVLYLQWKTKCLELRVKQVESTMRWDNAVKLKVEKRVLTFTSVGPGFETAAVVTG